MIGNEKKEFGDYQTPLYFTEEICNYLKNKLKLSPNKIIEPTCGVGNFLKSCSSIYSESQLFGIEINNDYLELIDKNILNLTLYNEDIFNFDFSKIGLNDEDYFLLIGNPPWVTNSELSKFDSDNLPEKTNFKGHSGINSLMGDSNFDISEYIILQLVDQFKNFNCSLVFLCKNIVARNIFKELVRTQICVANFKTLNIDANKVFNVSTSACLLIIQFDKNNNKNLMSCDVFDFKSPANLLYKFGYKNNKFYSNLSNSHKIEGNCSFEWRQGVKHDCSKIMELTKEKDNYKNKNKDIFRIEDDLVYYLLKSSDLKIPIINESNKYVIITQKRVREETDYIKESAPKTWEYLVSNEEFFNKRKSVIYKGAPRFSIFGIGEYSFSKYKVAVSGFYKKPLFSLVYNEKPIMLDDTCYFLSFDTFEEAYITMLILNTDLVQDFLKDIAFLDSKRPYTKKILKRIDIQKCLSILSFDELLETEEYLNLPNNINISDFEYYKDKYN
ncbi:hypothetical protein [uncultured Methanobrevibacter sp.]|uniref:hypothetical protein n=1 Tax=uncultured Methanobrevibacter sp. TaxID=253161 RepID=UPI0026107AC6|nr:hypothetical protein [uncultured Methanobrevibacter sp.]